ncbi:hypothetical protein D9M69_560740 [compost metagenome]
MWKVPPPGRERIRARTTFCVSSSTVSRTLADAAPWVPCTARKAFIMATAILLGSNETTAPLRRMIWYWANTELLVVAGADVDEPMGCFWEAVGADVLGEAVSMVPLSFVVIGLLAGHGVGEQDVRFQFGLAALFGAVRRFSVG